MTAPGWYPDPSGDGTQRYWDGNAWGPSAPPPAASPNTPPLTPAGVQVPVLPPLPPKKKSRLKPLLITGGVLFLAWQLLPGLGGKKTESSSSSNTSSSSATKPTTKETGCGSSGPTCDGTPKVDGRYKVSGGGFLDTGISPGWIATPGKRPDARVCLWERLNGPLPSDLGMIIDGGNVTSENQVTTVRIEASDKYFWSQGCQPWVRLDRE